jgi:AGZA family xanthine/uracil permease-like MFS transporter
VVLNPLITGSFTADAPAAKRDALVAGVLTLAMSLIVNYPFAMATGGD